MPPDSVARRDGGNAGVRRRSASSRSVEAEHHRHWRVDVDLPDEGGNHQHRDRTLRRIAIASSLFEPVPLGLAVHRLGFVQADPIRAPARAQDLTLRHRVENYRAGDLEAKYASLAIEEDVFVNYGFVSSRVHTLMHPRARLGRCQRRHAAARTS